MTGLSSSLHKIVSALTGFSNGTPLFASTTSNSNSQSTGTSSTSSNGANSTLNPKHLNAASTERVSEGVVAVAALLVGAALL